MAIEIDSNREPQRHQFTLPVAAFHTMRFLGGSDTFGLAFDVVDKNGQVRRGVPLVLTRQVVLDLRKMLDLMIEEFPAANQPKGDPDGN